MAMGDIQFYDISTTQLNGAKRAKVAAGATQIYAGEPITRALGQGNSVIMGNNKPVVGTDYVQGIATCNSTQTASLAGYVDYIPVQPGVVYLVNPFNPLNWDTQAEYDALVGLRFVFDYTGGKFTLLTADGATNGVVVMPLDISRYPGKVAVCFRNGVSDLA